jgi:hypothetical protein
MLLHEAGAETWCSGLGDGTTIDDPSTLFRNYQVVEVVSGGAAWLQAEPGEE